LAHQGFDTGAVFVSQPMGQFPKHDTIDIAEYFGFEINELIKRRPAFQFSVDLLNHIDFAFTVVT
jgi:hypothetical protein